MDLFSIKVANAAAIDVFIGKVNSAIINPLITLLFALAAAFFLYGMIQFFGNQTNDEKKTTGKQHMMWGIIGITIMMGVFTLMNIILNTLNIKDINPEQGTVQLNLNYNPTYPPRNN